MSCIRDSFTIFWTPTSFGNCISWALSFITHVICLIDSGWLHSIVLLNGCPTVLVTPLYQNKQPLLGCLHGLWSYHMVPKQPISMIPSILGFTVVGVALSISAVLHDCLHAVKTSTTWETLTLPSSAASMTCRLDPLWTSAYMCWPWENIPRRFLPQWCWPLNHNVPAKRRFHFCHSVSC